MKRSVEQGCEPEKSSRKPASHNDEVNPKVKPSRFSVLLSEALGKSIEGIVQAITTENKYATVLQS